MKQALVVEEHKTNYVVSVENKEYIATVRGSFFGTDEFPKVGDIVMCSPIDDTQVVLEEVMPRRSTIQRKDVATGKIQVIVANIDIAFIVMGLDGDFNLSRLERFLSLVRESNIIPVIVLNKIDMVVDSSVYFNQVKTIAGDTPIHLVSAKNNQGLEILLTYFKKDTSVVMIGSSGAGKSTITNFILGRNVQPVGEVREKDSRGKHTTTSRHLFFVPNGGYLIDTPGVRELGLVNTIETDDTEIFLRLDEMVNECRFPNCDHEKSIGCYLLKMREEGAVSDRELDNFKKLQKEKSVIDYSVKETVSKEYQKHKRKIYKK